MGMYTEIFFRAEIDDEAADILQRINKREHMEPGQHIVPNHPLFSTERWWYITTMTSYYFPGANHFTTEKREYDEGYSVSFRANLKNYDGEIEKFFDWIDPHVLDYPGTFLGYSLYEEGNKPTLYFKKEATQ